MNNPNKTYISLRRPVVFGLPFAVLLFPVVPAAVVLPSVLHAETDAFCRM